MARIAENYNIFSARRGCRAGPWMKQRENSFGRGEVGSDWLFPHVSLDASHRLWCAGAARGGPMVRGAPRAMVPGPLPGSLPVCTRMILAPAQ